MIAFGVLLFAALASSAFAGFVRPVGVTYGFAAPYAVVGAPVTTYHHTVPTYTKVYAPVVPAVSTVHHTPTVSKVTNVDTYSTHHAVATPVAKVAYTSPAVTAVHQIPAVTKVHTYTSPVVPAVHTVPAYTYRVGYPYHLGTYGYGLGYGLSPYGVNYGYGVDYATILKKKSATIKNGRKALLLSHLLLELLTLSNASACIVIASYILTKSGRSPREPAPKVEKVERQPTDERTAM